MGRRRRAMPPLRGVVGAGVLLWAAALAVNRALLRVEGPSMLPTLWPDDVVLTLPGAARAAAGALVVVELPGADAVGRVAVKRIVARGRAHVATVDGVLHVDERPVAWPPGGLPGARSTRLGEGAWNVPAGHVFLLGDHVDASTDSRAWGPVPDARLRRRVVGVVRPSPRRRPS